MIKKIIAIIWLLFILTGVQAQVKHYTKDGGWYITEQGQTTYYDKDGNKVEKKQPTNAAALAAQQLRQQYAEEIKARQQIIKENKEKQEKVDTVNKEMKEMNQNSF